MIFSQNNQWSIVKYDMVYYPIYLFPTYAFTYLFHLLFTYLPIYLYLFTYLLTYLPTHLHIIYLPIQSFIYLILIIRCNH
jgi:hypothetical protein